MAGMIKSIFGLTTEDVRQQQGQQQRDFAGQLQRSGYKPLEAQLGTIIGTGLARGLMGGLGYEDPAMAKAREGEAAREEYNQAVEGMETNDPNRLYLLAQAGIERGAPLEDVIRVQQLGDTLKKLNQPKADEYIAVGKRVFNKTTGEFVTDPTFGSRIPFNEMMVNEERDFSQYAPQAIQEAKEAYERGEDPTMILQRGLINPATIKAQEEQAKSNVAAVAKRRADFKIASTQAEGLATAIQLLDEGLETGTFAKIKLQAGKLLKDTLGIDIGDLEQSEVFEAISNQQAMLMRNPASGMGLTGSTSNRDLTFLKGSVAGLSKTPEGNKLILKGLLKVYEMQKRVMAEQSRLIKENGGVPPLNLESKLEAFVIEQDVFGEDLRNQMLQLQEAGKGGVATNNDTTTTTTGGTGGTGGDVVYNFGTKQIELQ